MSDPHPLHTITLKGDIPDLERELLRRYCHELHGSDGSTLLQFFCHSVDADHALYLEMEAVLPRRQGTRRLRIPHTLVFLIESQSGGTALPVPPASALPDTRTSG
ncbi:MAG TPA: hypothetical protein VFM34_12465 [Moraxellaceae bacterium]|nr:hypothetical protein [Moraxellaceae bacterium]